MGNICRSPAAHCVLEGMVGAAGLSESFFIDSAGTIGIHAGERPDMRMRAALAERGYAVIGRARQIERADLDRFDLILAMDRENLRYVEALAGAEKHAADIGLFCDFCSRSDSDEVPDPYYGGDAGFEAVLDMIEDGCAQLVRRFRSQK